MSKFLCGLTTAIALLPCLGLAQATAPARALPVENKTTAEKTPTPSPTPAQPDLVSVRSVDRTIKVELRYATSRNAIGRPIYPRNFPALVRHGVAIRLAVAQAYLKARGFRLKIWDAYRPKSAQDQLWQFLPNSDFVANPAENVSLHNWGVAVDATLVYENGQAVEMPTDFDEFTPEATLRYSGSKGSVGEHLHILQRAMSQAGFLGLRTEWWHFIAKDWQDYGPIEGSLAPMSAPPNATRNSPSPSASTPANHPQSASR